MTLFNEPNSTRITLAQYEQVYRSLDAELRARNVRDHVHFMGGDLLGTTSPLGQSQEQWFTYLADHMGDLLDAWSVHIYWEFWDAGKIDRRLEAEVRTIFSVIPAEKRRPLFVTEFGVRGVPTFEGEDGFQPGSWPDGTGMSRDDPERLPARLVHDPAAQLGFNGTVKWDLYAAKYDAGTQDHSRLGPGRRGLASAAGVPAPAAPDGRPPSRAAAGSWTSSGRRATRQRRCRRPTSRRRAT